MQEIQDFEEIVLKCSTLKSWYFVQTFFNVEHLYFLTLLSNKAKQNKIIGFKKIKNQLKIEVFFDFWKYLIFKSTQY